MLLLCIIHFHISLYVAFYYNPVGPDPESEYIQQYGRMDAIIR